MNWTSRMRRNRNGNRGLTRRQALAGTSATASMILAWRPQTQAAASLKVCILTPEAAQGPFYFDPKLVRTDITEGKPGAPLALMLQVVEDENCAAARVDIWHSDGLGVYSGYPRQATGSTEGGRYSRQATERCGRREARPSPFRVQCRGWHL